jgi:hypothetical protein
MNEFEWLARMMPTQFRALVKAFTARRPRSGGKAEPPPDGLPFLTRVRAAPPRSRQRPDVYPEHRVSVAGDR